MEQKIKKYGLKHEPIIIGKDYLLGGFSNVPQTEIQSNGQWMDFLVEKENQSRNGEEPMSCVSHTILNCVEILIRKLYNK